MSGEQCFRCGAEVSSMSNSGDSISRSYAHAGAEAVVTATCAACLEIGAAQKAALRQHAEKLVEAAQLALLTLERMTTEEFAKGGDYPAREALAQALFAVGRLPEAKFNLTPSMERDDR